MSNQENKTEQSKIYKEAPVTEPERQYYFIEQARKEAETDAADI